MKKTILPLVTPKILLQPITICIIINIFVVLFLLFVRDKLPPVVPLYYGRPEAADQLAPQIFLVLPAIIAIAVVLINVSLTKLLKDTFLRQVLAALTVIVTLLSTVTILKIVFLVGNL